MNALQRQINKSYRGTAVYRLRVLLNEQTRWQRKATIAANKLAHVRRAIDDFAKELADERLKYHENQSPTI